MNDKEPEWNEPTDMDTQCPKCKDFRVCWRKREDGYIAADTKKPVTQTLIEYFCPCGHEWEIEA
jgi:hypothetical protein